MWKKCGKLSSYAQVFLYLAVSSVNNAVRLFINCKTVFWCVNLFCNFAAPTEKLTGYSRENNSLSATLLFGH